MTWLVEYHQYLGEATKLRESRLKRILAEPGIDELLALHRADALASTGDAWHVDYCEPISATSRPARSTRRRWSPATTSLATASAPARGSRSRSSGSARPSSSAWSTARRKPWTGSTASTPRRPGRDSG